MLRPQEYRTSTFYKGWNIKPWYSKRKKQKQTKTNNNEKKGTNRVLYIYQHPQHYQALYRNLFMITSLLLVTNDH